MLAVYNRSTPPNHNDKSGFTGFLTSIILSVPSRASAISCTINGLTVERAPIHKISTSFSMASFT